MQLLGERVARGHRSVEEEPVELARGRGDEVAVDAQHLGALLDRPERRPGDHRVDVVEAERELRDDAEVAAAAADRPVEVRVLVGARADALAAREHHLGREQVVDRQPALAGQVPEAAAEGQAADAGGRDDPARGREAVLVGGGVDLAPGAAAADADGAGLRVDLDRLHRREVDHDPVVDGAEAAAVVAAAADRQRQVVLGGEADRPGDVVGVRAAGDQRRAAVDHRVVDGARLGVGRVVGTDQLAAETAQLLARGLGGCGRRAHASPFSSGFQIVLDRP